MDSLKCDLSHDVKAWVCQAGIEGIKQETREDRWAIMSDVFQFFKNSNSSDGKPWNDDLLSWQLQFPFQSFIAKSVGVKRKRSPSSW